MSKKFTNPEILCIDRADSGARGRQKVLEDAGFVVMRAHDENAATELLQLAAADIVFVDTCVLNDGETRIAAKIKRANPHVRVVFICDEGMVPAAWRGDIDIVIDASDFNTKAPWLIGELQSTGSPFFTQWFEAWKRRPSEAGTREQSIRTQAAVQLSN
jgi:DNA-binding NtrC family response regulator